MRNEVSQRLSSGISSFEHDWGIACRYFRDAKSKEFEIRFYKPLLEEASIAVKWLVTVETEINQAQQFCKQQLP